MKRIPFKPKLARAIREGRKTETRRIITPQPFVVEVDTVVGARVVGTHREVFAGAAKPRYLPGEIVGVCEPWRTSDAYDHLSGADMVRLGHPIEHVIYEATDPRPPNSTNLGRPRLARFLPDAFVRTRIRILDVSAERLQEITEEQARAEGVATPQFIASDRYWPTYRDGFRDLWNTIHGEESPWESNPWVWRYQFTREP